MDKKKYSSEYKFLYNVASEIYFGFHRIHHFRREQDDTEQNIAPWNVLWPAEECQRIAECIFKRVTELNFAEGTEDFTIHVACVLEFFHCLGFRIDISADELSKPAPAPFRPFLFNFQQHIQSDPNTKFFQFYAQLNDQVVHVDCFRYAFTRNIKYSTYIMHDATGCDDISCMADLINYQNFTIARALSFVDIIYKPLRYMIYCAKENKKPDNVRKSA